MRLHHGHDGRFVGQRTRRDTTGKGNDRQVVCCREMDDHTLRVHAVTTHGCIDLHRRESHVAQHRIVLWSLVVEITEMVVVGAVALSQSQSQQNLQGGSIRTLEGA